MSNRQRNRKRNKHVVHYWWRGDIEDEKYWRFPTKEAAWAHMVGQIRKRARAFEETTYCKTVVDWYKLKSDLMDGGKRVVLTYCQNDSWFDNWEYFHDKRGRLR